MKQGFAVSAQSDMRVKMRAAVVTAVSLGVSALTLLTWTSHAQSQPAKPAAVRPALTVTTTKPQSFDWPVNLTANGSIAAWQEAIVGAETGGLRLTHVLVSVGDTVRRGQVLARMATEAVQTDLERERATVAEAEANAVEARDNAERARQLQASGSQALSTQQLQQYFNAEKTTAARLEVARSRVRAEKLRLKQTLVLAPDDGVISARSATVGAVAQPAQELFRLIRQNRMEWRAEMVSAELARIKPGQVVSVKLATGTDVPGRVRMIAPTIDAQTRTALVYVDLARSTDARPGMFASGSFDVGRAAALTVAASSVVVRDGSSFVFRVVDNKVVANKVTAGRRSGDRIEILQGLAFDQSIVATGAGFLNDGDTVRVEAK